MLTGLWHGASWNFLWWGLYFFCILAVEKAGLLSLLARAPRGVRHAYALFWILIGWLIFAYDGSTGLRATEGLLHALRLFGVGAESLTNGLVRYELVRNLPWLLAMAVGCTPLCARVWAAWAKKRPTAAGLCRAAGMFVGLTVCTAYLVDSTFSPFLYYIF